MNIKQKLEAEHSKSLTVAITKYIGNDRARFKVLLEVFLKGDHRISQRAAWPLSYVLCENPELLKGHHATLISKLKEKNNHPAIHRNILRVFQEVEIPEKFQGELIDICFELMRSEMVPGAIRAFAITTAANIVKPYPELKNELLLIFKELMQITQKPAVSVRIKAAIKFINKP